MQNTQTQENIQEQHNNYLIISSGVPLKILYNSDYSSNDFPSKFEKEEVEKVYHKKNIVESKKTNELSEVKENPDNYIKPLDIVKIFKIYTKASSEKDYWVHAGIYLGNKKICHAWKRKGVSSIKIDEWDSFFNFLNFSKMEKKTQQMIVCYRPNPKINFKEREEIMKHITGCIENSAKYFKVFGEFKIREEDEKKTNNCECLANRCVLGLGFSELADHKNKLEERVFENIEEEIKKNGDQLDSLNEQKEHVDAQIEIITNKSN